MSANEPRVLLIEADPDLCQLVDLILTEAGYQVTAASPDVDLVGVAEQTHPDVIVLSIRPQVPADRVIVDNLQANAETRKIPVVIVSTFEPAAAEAQAAPISRTAVIAPYDIEALEAAVAEAVQKPPPAAVLPTATQPVPTSLAYASEALNQRARDIVLQTIRRLREIEPYKSRFPELSRGLVDNLGVILGAIASGLGQDLSPETVFSVPAIRHALSEHVKLRESQGLGPAEAILEYQVLLSQIDRFLRGLISRPQFSALDAFDVSQRAQHYVDTLVLHTAESYQANPESNQ